MSDLNRDYRHVWFEERHRLTKRERVQPSQITNLEIQSIRCVYVIKAIYSRHGLLHP